ncbi:uncharacterized protein EI97DRAFT_455340 [Westerdykella ornata]|uniref:Uncharacterized protein n=1 Tax=Westerdykella ornata TaxID=318751 RepID=A0A6A6JV00_WESOR|nr:uncharacterized protein EI97DRAFT_455340 [Westerdykella ornata]KAF2280450.1 hypothetical protein EI97DRAFT_455340 [Westerdykella ornata]
MANSGASALQSSRSISKGFDVPPRDKMLDNLIEDLFFKGAEGQKLNQIYLKKVGSVYTNILRYLGTQTDSPDNRDAVIFCDGSRFKRESPHSRWATDMTNGRKLRWRERQCEKGSEKIAAAVTWLGTADDDTRRWPAQIQLCDWFVEFLKQHEMIIGEDIRLKTKIGRKVIRKASQGKWLFNQIDVYNVLDKVLLHELTHTWMGGELDDVKVKKFGIIPRPAYGWARCKELAKTGSLVDNYFEDAPDNNAETVALFASGE